MRLHSVEASAGSGRQTSTVGEMLWRRVKWAARRQWCETAFNGVRNHQLRRDLNGHMAGSSTGYSVTKRPHGAANVADNLRFGAKHRKSLGRHELCDEEMIAKLPRAAASRPPTSI